MDALQQLAPGAFRRRYESLDLNIGVVAGDRELLLVDTRASHRQAQELMTELAPLGAGPIRRVINTHWHWDHVWGNAVFAAAEIWGHEACRRHMLEYGEADRAAVLDWLPEEHHDSVREVIITPPTHTFSDQAAFDLAGRAVSARYVGLAHTDSDVVVAVPAAGVVFAGDIIEEGAAPSFDVSYPLDWPAALDRLLALEWEVAVPGHGDIVDRYFVERQRDQIAELGGIARDAFSAGIPADYVDLSGAPFGEQAARVAVQRSFRQLADDLAGG